MEVSAGEIEYIRQGVEQDIRNDGRSCTDYREFTVLTDVIPHANGSARVKLGSTDVLVAVNAELAEPDSGALDVGRIVCSVECAPSASLDFEGRGAEVLNTQLTSVLERMLQDSNAVNLRKLCVIPGKQCWVLYVDALVLDSSGNLFDAVSLAAKAALRLTTIPAVKVLSGPDGQQEIDVSDDPFDAQPLGDDNVPIIVSLVRIGNRFVVDPSLEEEQCAAGRVSVSVTRQGRLAGVHKSDVGGIAPVTLLQTIQFATQVADKLFKTLDNALHKARTADADADNGDGGDDVASD